MNMKKAAFKLAAEKLKSTQKGRKLIKTATAGSFLIGTSLLVYTLADYGRKLSEEQRNSSL